eukprot:CAMPEP_0176355546 /NCGR_PEP_ID=MMETSP0126-20121128/13371_1 /TAXON_ID=141414 ORGANISM="Strombidinopsis acuminatum, Strain SPMC142" /NCGR_SAMPLE_ID=MMETSP0126 /ASSEMBLY_ACC=CAM_ASM_000229 /LENGTH=60 /DNA_ID=CAMNT_0017708241 /DNA_START=869 /DNA_END=1048 /DNA_ORIENTATION=+
MVVVAHAVVDPGTVMIISFDTTIANVAMTRSIRTDYITIRAEQDWIELVKHISKCNAVRW